MRSRSMPKSVGVAPMRLMTRCARAKKTSPTTATRLAARRGTRGLSRLSAMMRTRARAKTPRGSRQEGGAGSVMGAGLLRGGFEGDLAQGAHAAGEDAIGVDADVQGAAGAECGPGGGACLGIEGSEEGRCFAAADQHEQLFVGGGQRGVVAADVQGQALLAAGGVDGVEGVVDLEDEQAERLEGFSRVGLGLVGKFELPVDLERLQVPGAEDGVAVCGDKEDVRWVAGVKSGAAATSAEGAVAHLHAGEGVAKGETVDVGTDERRSGADEIDAGPEVHGAIEDHVGAVLAGAESLGAALPAGACTDELAVDLGEVGAAEVCGEVVALMLAVERFMPLQLPGRVEGDQAKVGG